MYENITNIPTLYKCYDTNVYHPSVAKTLGVKCYFYWISLIFFGNSVFQGKKHIYTASNCLLKYSREGLSLGTVNRSNHR